MGLDGETSAPGGTAAMAVATSSGRAAGMIPAPPRPRAAMTRHLRGTIRSPATPATRAASSAGRAAGRPLGWDHEDELRTEDGLSLDMAQPSTKTAVEFDGPTHYLQGPDGPSLDGRTAFKMRLLGRLGWTCAAVPYFEWDPLLASGATEPYLRGVLARLR